jgi:alcohol dehydrogenase class IV
MPLTIPSPFAYDFLSPSRIVFGWGRRKEIGKIAGSLGKRAFLVSGSRTLEKNGTLAKIEKSLQDHGIETHRLATISHEPETRDVDATVAKLVNYSLDENRDFVIAIGGGSAVDLAKAVTAMATNRHGNSVADFLEGVGEGLTIERNPLPMLAMPTTAGTGSEATKNAVISSYDPAYKKSLRSEKMIPELVLVDPELTVSVPANVTAHTGMDAITQLIESHISRRAQPIPSALCLHGLSLAAGSIVEACENSSSRPAREAMSHAALLSGMALANSGLGMAHGVAAALGVHCRVPHGLACAVMLPVAMRVNRDVCADRLAEIGRVIGEQANLSDSAAVDFAVEWVTHTCKRIGIPRSLSDIGVTRNQLPALVKSSRGNSMNGNPRELSDDELMRIFEELA